MAEVDSGSKEVRRDSPGRFVRGSSGNPAGRGPGRPIEEVNQLADQAIEAALQRDMDVVPPTPVSQGKGPRPIWAVLSGEFLRASPSVWSRRRIVGGEDADSVVRASKAPRIHRAVRRRKCTRYRSQWGRA